MRVIVTTTVAPGEVLRFDVDAGLPRGRLLHRDLPRDVFLVHPELYSVLVDHLGPLEQAGIAVDDLTQEEAAEAHRLFHTLHERIRRGELVPGRD